MKKIPIASPSIIGNEKKYVNDCVDTTWISSVGKYIDMFEKDFAKYLGVKHAASCSNGTVALHLALLALGIKQGDEVICPTFTYVATANSIKYVGAEVVLADCDSETFNIDPSKLESLITTKTKAMIIVPIYGHPCDYDKILKIAKKHNLYVIEDAAEALGSEYRDKKCGTFGHISTFSFFGNKVITTGEGGMIVTNDDELDKKVRLYKGQGMDPEKRYWFKEVGYNYRMTNIEAAIGLAQLENLNLFLEKRRKIAVWYNTHLSDVTAVTKPIEKDYAKHSFWMYSITLKDSADRDALMSYLDTQGVETRPFFYPMHIMPVYDYAPNKEKLKVAEDISSRGLSLPTFYDLTANDIEYITNSIREYFNNKAGLIN